MDFVILTEDHLNPTYKYNKWVYLTKYQS
jgi:hypothetical protein